MRHWNSSIPLFIRSWRACFYSTYEALKLSFPQGVFFLTVNVFTLPMRHWNPNFHIFKSEINFSFYSTYEALKPISYNGVSFDEDRFYSTYEALKPGLPGSGKTYFAGFYSTYEALKLRSWHDFLHSKIIVFTLPMRHWNNAPLHMARV